MVNVNQEECIGCGACADSNKEVFEIVEGKAIVKEGKNGESVDVSICPVGAIKE